MALGGRRRRPAGDGGQPRSRARRAGDRARGRGDRTPAGVARGQARLGDDGLLALGVRVPDVQAARRAISTPGNTPSDVAANADFRKFDDGLRMTLDCSPEFADAMESAARGGGRIRRIRRAPAGIAQITCYVPSIAERGHMHFVDGAGGGYTMAAKAMKARQGDESGLSRSGRGYPARSPARRVRDLLATGRPWTPPSINPARKPGARLDADDGAIFRDQGGQSGLPAVLPHGRLLRAVLRGRGDRQPRARHRADQARQARGRGHPHVRRADRARRRLSPAADRARPSRRRLRANGGPRRGEEARREIGRPARRRAAGHAGHDHRGAAAGARPRQSAARGPAREGRGRDALRPRLARHFHRRVHAGRDRRGGPCASRSRGWSRARSSRRRACSPIPASRGWSRRRASPRRRSGAKRRRRERGAARLRILRRRDAGRASAPSRAPRSAPRRSRSPMSSARRSTRRRGSRRRRGARAARAWRSTPRRAPISNSTRTLAGERARLGARHHRHDARRPPARG